MSLIFSFIYYLLISIIFLISFRDFAAHLAPYLKADHAVHILMAHDLRLPEDLYFWGQDRLGSIVPILGHWLYQVLPISAAAAVGYVQYFLLLIGFICLASLFKNPLAKLIFALAWFFPLDYFKELVQIAQPYGPQFAFLGLALVLMQKLWNPGVKINSTYRQILITLTVASLWLSLWISDLSIVPMLILSLIIARQAYQQTLKGKIKKTVCITDAINMTLVSLLGLALIIFAKQNSSAQNQNYSTFNTFQEAGQIVTKLINSLISTVSFQTYGNVFFSLHAIFALIILTYITYFLIFRAKIEIFQPSIWLYLFIISGIIGFILIIFSHWVYLNDGNLRYFVFVYLCCWLSALFFAEGLRGKTAQVLLTLLAITALLSSLSLPHYVFSLEKPPSTVQKMAALASLGKAGLIGNYHGSSYLLCSANPELLNCTPYDDPPRNIERVRCWHCVEKVLNSPMIYLVKEKWLEDFPEQIEQFGQCLMKADNSQKIAGYTMAAYTKSKDKCAVKSTGIYFF